MLRVTLTYTVFVIFIGLIWRSVLHYRDWLNVGNQVILKVRPGPCHTIKNDGGSEDIIHIGNGIFLASCLSQKVERLKTRSPDEANGPRDALAEDYYEGFNFGNAPGDVSAIDVNGSPRMFTLNNTNAHSTSSIIVSPTGISSWKDPKTGKLYVYVITHPMAGDAVQVFEVKMPIRLSYIKSIKDQSFTFMNTIVVVGMDKFYITKYTLYRDKLRMQIEHLSHLKNGKVLYYDGQNAREVSSGHFLPNGINISPDQKMVYVTEMGGKKLIGFRRDSNNNLEPAWNVELDTAPDNINVDENGDLWIGCHPVLWKILDFYGIFGALKPSQVIRVKIRNETVSNIEEIYADDGNECTASTVAAFANGKLVIGTVFKQTVVCDIKHLSQ